MTSITADRLDAATRRRFNRAHISRRDFAKAIGFIKAAADHPQDSPEYEALLLAAIIAYARPFSPNERDKSARSDARLDVDVRHVLGSDSALHARLVEIRNKAVAHSEFAYYPVESMPGSSRYAEGSHGFVSVSRNWHVVNEQIDLTAFERIANALCVKCTNDLFDIDFAGIIKRKP